MQNHSNRNPESNQTKLFKLIIRKSTGCFCDSTVCFYQFKWVLDKRKAHKQFILVHSCPKSYIQSSETTGYLLCNQNPDYKCTIKEVTLNTSSHTLPLTHNHHRNQNTLWFCTYTTIFRNSRDTKRITPDGNQIKRLQQSYSTSLRKPKSLNENLENSNLFSHFHKCLNVVLSF